MAAKNHERELLDYEDGTIGSQFQHVSSVFVAGDKMSDLVIQKRPNTMSL